MDGCRCLVVALIMGLMLPCCARAEGDPLLAAGATAGKVVIKNSLDDGVCRAPVAGAERSDRRKLSREVEALQDVNQTLPFGSTSISSLGLAVLANDPLVLERLFERGAHWPGRGAAAAAMYEAAQHGSSDLLRVLLHHGLAPDLREVGMMTPLMAAAWADRADNALMLLNAGADATLVLPNNTSALLAAVVCRNQSLVDALLTRHARPDSNTKKQANQRGIVLAW